MDLAQLYGSSTEFDKMTDRLEIIDDFISPRDSEQIRAVLLGGHFPWYWNGKTTFMDGEDQPYDFQFVHTVYNDFQPNSDYFKLCWPLIIQLKPTALIRIKFNLNPRTDQLYRFDFHRDITDADCVTAVYYLNTNNGYTEFESGEKVQSTANRLVKFPGAWLHTGTTCTDEKCRLVMNINYIP